MDTTASPAQPSSGPAEPASEIIGITGLTKSFNGITVLNDVRLSVRAGEIHGLVGANGSGKSTLIKILAGFHDYDHLEEFRLGDVAQPSPDFRSIASDHFAFVHQDRGILPTLSIADNCALMMGYPRHWAIAIDRRRERQRVQELLDGMGIAADPDQPMSTLGPAEATLVAMGRALASTQDAHGSLLVLDEPTAALPEAEAFRVLRAAKQLAARGSGVVFVSHKLSEVLATCDVVTVLRDGVVAAERLQTERLSRDSLVERMLGRALGDDQYRGEPSSSASQVLSISGLSGNNVSDIELSVSRGEILGITGLAGCGKSELGRLLAGRERAKGGQVHLKDSLVPPGSPRAALRAGIAYVPSERLSCGSLPPMTAFENLTLPDLKRFRQAGFIRSSAEVSETKTWMERTKTVPLNPWLSFQSFSGGNQQKMVLAKWLRLSPSVLIVDEPTQGVDVGAKEDVYELLRSAADNGTALIVMSSEPDELARVCDRVVVLVDGRLGAELTGEQLTEDNVTGQIFAGKEAIHG